MSGQKYVNLLKSKLDLHTRVLSCEIFMHDGAPCHRSKVVKEFLEQKLIQMLEWPGNSLDLNPLKKLWNLMNNKVSEKHSSSLNALQTAIKEAWVRERFADYFCKLIKSMPRGQEEKQGLSQKILIVNVFLSFLCNLVMFLLR